MIEDLTAFFVGLPTAKLSWANGSTEHAYFDDAFFNPQLGEMELNTTEPRATCIFAEVQHLKRKDRVEVNGKAFDVLEVQPDGTGFATVTFAHA